MPRPLYPRKRPGTLCIGGWVGLRAGLDGCKKSLPQKNFFFTRHFICISVFTWTVVLCGLMSAMCVVVLLEREIDRGYTSCGVRDVELLVEA